MGHARAGADPPFYLIVANHDRGVFAVEGPMGGGATSYLERYSDAGSRRPASLPNSAAVTILFLPFLSGTMP
jgi:hypothetical protein